jgi:hypothetical protein
MMPVSGGTRSVVARNRKAGVSLRYYQKRKAFVLRDDTTWLEILVEGDFAVAQRRYDALVRDLLSDMREAA